MARRAGNLLATDAAAGPGPRRRLKTTCRLGATLVAATLAGCGSDLAQVSGVVTLDGEPLRGGDGVKATVYFQPAAGRGNSAVGLVDENGRYELSTGSQSGITPGEYAVTCSAAELIQPSDPAGTPGGRRITDMKYANAKTSGFQFVVEPGYNEFDLALESPPGSSRGRRN